MDYTLNSPVMSLERNYKLNCQDYDKLLFSLFLPRKATFKVEVITDKGTLKKDFPPSSRDLNSTEFELDLVGSKEIKKIKMIIEAEPGVSNWIRWIGFQNSQKLKDWQNYWKKYSKIKWDKYLVPADTIPAFTASTGIVLTSQQLKQLQKFHTEYVSKHGDSPFTEYARKIASHPAPEELIGEMVSHGLRFTRYRNYLRWKNQGSPNGKCRVYAVTGAILKDAKLLRLAARTALSLAACGKWGTGFEGHVTGTNFDHRSFDESEIVFNLVMALELAGEMFTDAGKTFILRSIAQRGIGQINYVVWRYPYIFDCNQLAAFSRGRIPGYLALEKNWQHVKPYTDLAIKELDSSIKKIFAADGGFPEGPAYFQYTLGSALPAYYNLATARKISFEKSLPKSLFHVASYANLMISTCDDQYFIPLNDCHGTHGIWLTPIAFLSKMFPQSQYTRIFKRFMARKKGNLDTMDIFIWLFASEIPVVAPKYKTFAEIKSINTASSTRKLDNEYVKILVVGDSNMAGHRHEDAGSFVLEFAGQTFAMDSNSIPYNDPWSPIIKRCQRHNTIIPTGINERPAPQKNKTTPLTASGDANRFHARMNLVESWKKYFNSLSREWTSDSPDQLTITDRYSLKKGNGVQFQWLTMLPAKRQGNQVVITGTRGKVVINIPSDSECKIETLNYWNKGKIQNKISFLKKSQTGEIKVKIKLEQIK